MPPVLSSKNNPSLALGPMSTESIEAVFQYSHFHRKELMLIASKNQIDHSGGYVNKWTTRQYMDYVSQMREKYPNAVVKICRDHCGPGFNGNFDLSDTYKTIEEDIKCGFDLVHIDFCHYKGQKDEQLAETKKAIEHCLKLKPTIELEIGTDENRGTNYSLPNIKELEREIDYLQSFSKPLYYVVQTGSLVMEINQVGSFNQPFVSSISKMLHTKGLKLKEHNADYLSKGEINMRKGIVDAMNIAPQLGVIQTQTIITRCLIHGICLDAFLDEVYAGGKWKKWLDKNTADNKMLCCVIAGHYHFSSPPYKTIIEELNKHEDIKETIIGQITKLIHHYAQQ
jgi:hypothetical protein